MRRRQPLFDKAIAGGRLELGLFVEARRGILMNGAG
jgi:hypothetical protein